jgi:hypothetical protein
MFDDKVYLRHMVTPDRTNDFSIVSDRDGILGLDIRLAMTDSILRSAFLLFKGLDLYPYADGEGMFYVPKRVVVPDFAPMSLVLQGIPEFWRPQFARR